MASQALVSAGISTMGVGNVSETGVSVVTGITVAVRVGISVGAAFTVGVFDGTRVAVGGADVDEAGTTVGLALNVAAAVEGGGVIVELAT